MKSKVMIQNTVENIEEKNRLNISLIYNKTKLPDLLIILKSGMIRFLKVQPEYAASITGFIKHLMHNIMRLKKNPIFLKLSVESISNSLKGFAISYSRLNEV
jgi:hypothetical protein